MRHATMGRTLAPILALLALAGGCGGPSPGRAHAPAGGVDASPQAIAAGSTLVIIVRHAEAEHEPGGDPPLTEAGLRRADRLAALLRDAAFDVIHTTDYRRTRSTAGPTAVAAGLEPAVYDGRDQASFAAVLRRSGGRHLVVGHSNTIPDLVRLLGGEAGADIATAEHDRVYVLVLGGRDGPATSTALLRY